MATSSDRAGLLNSQKLPSQRILYMYILQRWAIRRLLLALCVFGSFLFLIPYFRSFTLLPFPRLEDSDPYDDLFHAMDQMVEPKGKPPEFEALLIDAECIRALAKNSTCMEPIAVALSRKAAGKWKRNRWTKVHYWISVGDQNDYWALDAVSRRHQPKRRLLPIVENPIQQKIKTNHGHHLNIWVPPDADRFERHWKNSRFVDCLGIQMNRTAAARTIKLDNAEVVRNFRNAMDLNLSMTTFVVGGTRLGWYRECDIIPHTQDIDFAVSFGDLSEDYIPKMEKTFTLSHRLGFYNDSLEFAVIMKGIRLDVFTVYEYNATMDYVPGIDFGQQRMLKWLTPKTGPHLCTGDLLGYLIYIPCKVEPFLEMDYGPNWRVDKPTSGYDYTKEGKIIRGNVYTGKEWDEVAKYY